jgi:uncharacterized protein YcgL (UPF0745 family)
MNKKYICLGFQLINVIMNNLNQLNKICMFYSSINQKGMQDYANVPKWHTFIRVPKFYYKP